MVFTKQHKFIGAVALQLAVIFAIVLFKTSILSGGATVFLEIKPVDPRDFLRGDYVTFSYMISEIDRSQFSFTPYNGATVYVPLNNYNRKFWTAGYGILDRIPKDNNGQVYIKGTVSSGGGSKKSTTTSNWQQTDGKVGIKYGIEEFFIPENQGRGVNFWNKKVHASVAVNEDGNAVLRHIYFNEELWY